MARRGRLQTDVQLPPEVPFKLSKFLEITQSLHASKNVVDGMIHEVCHNAWVNEVVAKRKEHSVNWVLSVGKEINVSQHD